MRNRIRQPDFAIGSIGRGSTTRWGVYQGVRGIHCGLPDAATARWVRDLYELDVLADDPRWDELGGKRVLSHADCLEHSLRQTRCGGEVEYRAVSAFDPRWPRCDRHWEELLLESSQLGQLSRESSVRTPDSRFPDEPVARLLGCGGCEMPRQVSGLDAEAKRISAERLRLVDDARSLAGELIALTDAPAKRFPPDEPAVGAQSDPG